MTLEQMRQKQQMLKCKIIRAECRAEKRSAA